MEVFTPLSSLFLPCGLRGNHSTRAFHSSIFPCFLFCLHSEGALQDLVRLGLRGSKNVIFMFTLGFFLFQGS